MVSLQNRLNEDLASLRDLLERGDVKKARALVEKLHQRWPDSESVRRYARVLAVPTASMRAGEPTPPHDREYAWLNDHGAEYPGYWLAVLEDRLLAADPDFAVVLGATRGTPGGERALLYFQPGSPG
jgi:hypothetical protein